MHSKRGSLEFLTNFTFIHTPLLSLKKLKITLYVTNVAILAKSWSINVPNVISTGTLIVCTKDKCGFNFYFILDLVHRISGAWYSSNDNAIILFNALSWHPGLDRTEILYQLMVVCFWFYPMYQLWYLVLIC